MRKSIILNLKGIYDGIIKKKNVVCFLLVIVMIMPTFTAVAQDESKVTFCNGKFTGITSEEKGFMLYSGDERTIFQNITITIDYLDVHEDVDILGKISTADGDMKFHFIGDLYVSEKQDQGIDAYVGQIIDCENNFVVNYFELDMDILGVSFNAESIMEKAPSEIDFYENYIDKERSIAPCIIDYEEKQTVEQRSTHSYSVEGPAWYTKEVVRGWFGNETIYEYYAEPEIYGNIVDVGTVDNVFSIEAGTDKNEGTVGDRIEFEMYTGVNTIFTSGKFGGECKVNGSEADNNTQFDLIIGLVTAIGGVNPYADAAVKISSMAALLFNATSTIDYSLESEFITGNSGVNRYVVCNRFDRSVLLNAKDHCITFSGFVSTINSATTSNQSTNCIVRWKYNMCCKNKILDNGPATIQKVINYTANMK